MKKIGLYLIRRVPYTTGEFLGHVNVVVQDTLYYIVFTYIIIFSTFLVMIIELR